MGDGKLYLSRYRILSLYMYCLLIHSTALIVTFNFRLRATGKSNADGVKKTRTRDRAPRAIPAPEANAELQANLDVRAR